MIVAVILMVTVETSAVEVRFADGNPDWQRLVARYVLSVKTDNMVDSLKVYLINRGFFDGRVGADYDNPDSGLRVTFGERYHLGQIIITGDFPDTIIVNRPFARDILDGVVDSIISSLQSLGYYYASLSPEKYSAANSTLDIATRLDNGPRLIISAIEIKGLKRTDRDFLRHYLVIATGDTLIPERIRESTRILDCLDFVHLERDPEIIPDPGLESARIRYCFIEARQFYFEGLGGYIPEDDGYFIWYFDLRGRNIFGRGQKAGLTADYREGNKSVFNVYYGQPVFWLGNGDITLSLQTRDYRDQFYEFGVGLEYGLDLFSRFAVRSSLGWKNVEPADSNLRSFSVYNVGFGIETGTISEKRDASSGYALAWNITYSGRRYDRTDNQNELLQSVYNDTRNELTVKTDLRPLTLLSFYCRAGFRDIESSEKPLPVSEMFYVGGPPDLRGYRNDQFLAQRLVSFTFESRMFLSDRDCVYPFVDGAYFEWYDLDPDLNPKKNDDFQWGYGFGINLSAENRRLKVELSWGRQVDFGEPRLSITMSSRF